MEGRTCWFLILGSWERKSHPRDALRLRCLSAVSKNSCRSFPARAPSPRGKRPRGDVVSRGQKADRKRRVLCLLRHHTLPHGRVSVSATSKKLPPKPTARLPQLPTQFQWEYSQRAE